MIKENSDLFSDSQCKVCSAVLISESQKLAHYQVSFHIHIDKVYMIVLCSSVNKVQNVVLRAKY